MQWLLPLPEWLAIAAVCGLWQSSSARAGEPLPRNAAYENGPRQIFVAKCGRCHGEDRAHRKAGLNLVSIDGIRRGSETRQVIAAGDLGKSLLWKKVSSGAMPPGETERLTPVELKTLRAWIVQGVKSNAAPQAQPSNLTDEERSFWSFGQLHRPPVPSVSGSEAAATPVDSFLLARLEREGLAFSPPAEKRTLIRRLSLDLLGLPPTSEEVAAYLSDRSPAAYARLVDRLLSSPHYGERWGRHWLDVAGYADSNGYHRADSPRPLAYRYRDYVVRALNDDKPYDRFWIEQLAGDELYDLDRLDELTPQVKDAVVATHFLRNAPDGTDSTEGNEMVRTIERYAVLEQQLQITISAMFGLTVDCARCHSHKFDPIPQSDYYALQAVLYPAFNVKKWVPPAKRSIHLATRKQLAEWNVETRRVDARVAAIKAKLSAWIRENRPRGAVLFADDFSSKPAQLVPRWTNAAPGDDAPAGTIGVNVDSSEPPGAEIAGGVLKIIEAGSDNSGWLATAQSFDWTPEHKNDSIQATFELVDDKLTPGGSPAARIGFYLGLHDYNDNSNLSGGNVLFDGNPAGGAAVVVDYPGADAQSAGRIGKSGFVRGHHYGVRVTNIGDGKFKVEQLVDWMPEEPAVTLTGEQLRDGAFGFEYCCSRSFVVDNVVVERNSNADADTSSRAALADFAGELKERQAGMAKAIKEVESLRPEQPGRIAWVNDLSPEAPDVPLLKRGRYFDPGPPVAPAGLSVLSQPGSRFDAKPTTANARTTGRRLAFARWATQTASSEGEVGRAAALLARVQVNRIWMWHFGRGLVETPGNFGALGARPTHPRLLEWLAAEYVAAGWSLKHLQRLILTSNAYRQATTPTGPALAVDRANRLLWGFPAHRLESEAIRDSMLAVAGLLNRSMAGPAVPFEQLADRQVVVPLSSAAGVQPGNRRSLYLQYRRSAPVTFLQTFDQAAAEPNCLQRSTSTVVSQALTMLNSRFAIDAARAFSERVRTSAGGDPGRQVELAFQLAYGRPASPGERARTLKFLDAQLQRHSLAAEMDESSAAKRALDDLCQTLLASNEFVYQQ